MANLGIDYGMGTVNIDKETGIRYGVISQHSVMPEALDYVEYDYGKARCPECTSEAQASDDAPEEIEEQEWFDGKDYYCLECKKCFWSDRCFPDEALGWSYERHGYKLCDCLDTDIFVIKSPYFTYASYCSPCVPGAGNLDSPNETGVKCYALGHDWFDEGKAPYPVYSVDSGLEVVIREVKEACVNCKGSGRDTVERLAKVRQETVENISSCIVSKLITVSDFKPEDNTFECFRCNGKGYEINKVEMEVEPNE